MLNFNPDNYGYEIVPAEGRTGIDLVITLKHAYVEPDNRFVNTVVPAEGIQKRFYMANQSVGSNGLDNHMLSMTDELLLDFFAKGSKKKKK